VFPRFRDAQRGPFTCPDRAGSSRKQRLLPAAREIRVMRADEYPVELALDAVMTPHETTARGVPS
jgi:hypothetical protein